VPDWKSLDKTKSVRVIFLRPRQIRIRIIRVHAHTHTLTHTHVRENRDALRLQIKTYTHDYARLLDSYSFLYRARSRKSKYANRTERFSTTRSVTSNVIGTRGTRGIIKRKVKYHKVTIYDATLYIYVYINKSRFRAGI